jgi:sugar O-acyltransferase (sialic acid O-acetyltransferase NeuD family)
MQADASALVIWGTGGHGRVVADVARAAGWSIAAWVTADPDAEGAWRARAVAPVLAEAEWPEWLEAQAASGRPIRVVPAMGDNVTRQRIAASLAGRLADAIVHPSAVVSPTATLGAGTVVMPLAVVNAHASVGEAVIVNSGAIVEHDCVLERGVHVSPGAVLSGGVRVAERGWIGAGATLLPLVRLGADAIAGAGATVTRDVPDGATVVGTPARVRP